MLRSEIQKIIENHDPEKAAFEIIKFLEEEGLSLCGNGWLDDDQRALDYCD